LTKVLPIWQNDRRKTADEKQGPFFEHAKEKPPVPRKTRKQAVLEAGAGGGT